VYFLRALSWRVSHVTVCRETEKKEKKRKKRKEKKAKHRDSSKLELIEDGLATSGHTS
jgi:hypothetical protein